MSDVQPENLPATSAAGDAQTPAAEVVDQREGMFGVRGTGDTSGFGGLRRQVALPGGTPKPYGSWYDGATDRHLRDDEGLRFEFCSGVSGVHYPNETGRELHAVYHLLSMTHNRRIRVEVSCPDADPHIPSIVSVYPANDWHERETWDFFGIIFDGHPALTRIQMPDDWPGHPQRKDYPLGGIDVEYKGAVIPPPDTRRSYN